MKTSTKIFIGIFIISLIGVIFTARYIFFAINIIDGNIVFNMSTLAWVGVGFNAINIISGNILFIRFLKTRKFNTVLFFSTVPLSLIFGGIAFVLSGINNFSGQTFSIVRTALNINVSNNNNYLWLLVVAIVYVVVMFFTLTIVSLPVKKVQTATKRLAYGEVSNKIDIGGNKQFLEIENSLNKINQNYKQNSSVINYSNLANKKSMPSKLIKYIGKKNIENLEVGGYIKKVVTILYCNIRNTGFVEKSFDIKDNFKCINSYLKSVNPIIRKFGGYIDKYLDDGVVAVFVNSESAMNCAINITTGIKQKSSLKKDCLKLDIGVSLHTTEVVFTIDTESSKKVPTLVFDSENICKSLDEINKNFGSSLIFTKDTLNNLPSFYKITYRYISNVKIQGDTAMAVFECTDVYSKQKRYKLNKFAVQFENGVRSFLNGKFYEAKNIFETVYKAERDDKVCYTYYNKCCENLSKLSLGVNE